MFKLIAVDLDDTLLNIHGKISETNQLAIREAEDQGVRVTVVSGRSHASTQRFIKELDLKNLNVSLNGAYIHDPLSGQIISSTTIDPQTIQALLTELKPFNVHINFYTGSTVLCETQSEYSDFYREMNNIEIEFVDSLLDYSREAAAGKLLLIGDHDRLKQIQLQLLGKFSDNLNIVFSKPIFLEIYPKSTSKGVALLKIAEAYGIQPSEIIAIGDGENDVSMFRQVGMGIAVGNASPAVQKEAAFVTLSNESDGVAYAINKFIFNK